MSHNMDVKWCVNTDTLDTWSSSQTLFIQLRVNIIKSVVWFVGAQGEILPPLFTLSVSPQIYIQLDYFTLISYKYE